MRNHVSYLLLTLILHGFTVIAQPEKVIPTAIPWHKGTIEDIRFSADGRYLVTKDSDHRLVIADLKARAPFFALEDVDRIILSEKHLTFYVVKETYGDGYTVQKRSIQNGETQLQLLLPHRIEGYTIKSPDIIALDETKDAMLLVPYENNTGMIIHAFHESGSIVKTFGPFRNDRVNAILPLNPLLVLTSQNVYEVEGDQIQTRVTAPSSGSFANMKLRNDTLFILSSRGIQLYNTTTWKLIREVNTPFFAGSSDRLQLAHDFEVDSRGSCWLVDPRVATSFLTNEASPGKRRYLMARIKDAIEYPLATDEVAGRIPAKGVESEFALHAGTDVIAFSTNPEEIIIQHLAYGELFRISKNVVEFKSIYFTNIPGRILLRHDPLRIDHTGVFMDLSTGRHEPVSLMESRHYRKAVKNAYQKTGIIEKLYVPNESGFQTAEYVTREGKSYLAFEMKDQSIQDTLTLNHATGTLRVAKEVGHLQWFDSKRKLVRELMLKTPEGKPIKFFEHYFDRYSYDSASALLAISYRGESIHNPVQYIIDVATGKIKKTFTERHAITLLDGSNYYVTDQGLFEYKSGQKVSGFPIKHQPRMSAYDFKVKGSVLTMAYVSQEDKIIALDLKSGGHVVVGTAQDVEKLLCDPHSDHLFTLSRDGEVKIWDGKLGGTSATLTLTGKTDIKSREEFNPSYVVQIPDGNFMGANRYFDLIALRKGTQQFPVQTMDQQFNRPDKVLKALGYADKPFVEKLETILSKRTQATIASSNDVTIKNKNDLPYFSSTGKVVVALDIPQALSAGEGIMVYVNGTALWTQPVRNLSDVKNLSVHVVDPVNYIRVTVTNAQGSESAGDYVIVNATPPAKRDLYVISIGVSQYANPKYNLRFAEKDAKEIKNNLSLTTSYENVKSIDFYDHKVDRSMLSQIKTFLKQARIQDQVIAYYAGHGLLDNRSEYYLSTHHISFEKPAEMGIHLDALLDAISESPARKKLVMLDACNSGLVDDMQIPSDEVSGNSAADSVEFEHRGVDVEIPVKPNYSTLYFTISTAASDNGVSIIAAAAGNEAALEGGGIKNGLFTYSFIKAIETGEANVDEDSIITVNELQSFIADQVQSLSRGRQRPSYRQANIYYDAPIFTATDPIFWHFLETVKANNVNFAQQLLKDGKVNINQYDGSKFTALHYSARQGYFRMTQLLLAFGADVNGKENSAMSPVYLAAFNGNEKVLYLLALSGADLEPLKKNQQIREKKNAAVLNIVDNFRKLEAYDNKVAQFLEALIEDTAKGEALFTTDINLNHKTYDGLTLLFKAIGAKKFDAAKWLVEHNADVNLATDDDLFTPLMITAYVGNAEFLKYLLGKGADKTKKDYMGRTALDFAKQMQNTEAQRLLEK